MGCGCRKNKGANSPTSRSTSWPTAGGSIYEVWRNGSYTGRAFSSIGPAQRYADQIGGEVRSK